MSRRAFAIVMFETFFFFGTITRWQQKLHARPLPFQRRSASLSKSKTARIVGAETSERWCAHQKHQRAPEIANSKWECLVAIEISKPSKLNGLDWRVRQPTATGLRENPLFFFFFSFLNQRKWNQPTHSPPTQTHRHTETQKRINFEDDHVVLPFILPARVGNGVGWGDTTRYTSWKTTQYVGRRSSDYMHL